MRVAPARISSRVGICGRWTAASASLARSLGAGERLLQRGELGGLQRRGDGAGDRLGVEARGQLLGRAVDHPRAQSLLVAQQPLAAAASGPRPGPIQESALRM